MADSIRERNIKAFRAVLESVTVANGYSNTIQSVQRFDGRGEQTAATPYIVIRELEELADDANNVQIEKRLHLGVAVSARQELSDARSSDEYLNSLRADIERAVMGNRTLNGLASGAGLSAMGSEPVDILDDEPELMTVLDFTLTYRHKMADPFMEV